MLVLFITHYMHYIAGVTILVLWMQNEGCKEMHDEAPTSRSWTFANITAVNTSASQFVGKSSFA
jgi:hypothetical protein